MNLEKYLARRYPLTISPLSEWITVCPRLQLYQVNM